MTTYTTQTTPVLDITHDVPATVDPVLAAILTWPRPHNSPAEHLFRVWLNDKIKELKPASAKVSVLAEGVTYVDLRGEMDYQSTTLFSCHIDTVDDAASGVLIPDLMAQKTKVPNPGVHKRKLVTYDDNFGTIALDHKNTVGGCLGADDGIGVWLMLKMIEAKVPGGYMFHTGEECGAHGSRGVLKHHADILKLYDLAIAFDRPRYSEVITHQGGQECCSQKLGTALCTALNAHGMGYTNSKLGSFTDTKVYRGVIAECVNLGVGYELQHGKHETQDYPHAVALLAALLKINWDTLPVDRDPLKADPVPKFAEPYKSPYGKQWDSARRGLFDDSEDSTYYKFETTTKTATKKAAPPPPAPVPPQPTSAYDELCESTLDDIEQWVGDSPDDASFTVASLLLEIGHLRADVATLKTLLGRGFA